MKNIHTKTEPQERSYHGNKPYLKIRRIQTEPRQRIRQFLRASIPLGMSVEILDAEAFAQRLF